MGYLGVPVDLLLQRTVLHRCVECGHGAGYDVRVASFDTIARCYEVHAAVVASGTGPGESREQADKRVLGGCVYWWSTSRRDSQHHDINPQSKHRRVKRRR